MPTFHYRAVAPSGELTEGEMEAADRADLVRRLQRGNYTPLRADEKPPEASPAATVAELLNRPLGRRRVLGRAGLALWTRELATLSQAGLTLERALDVQSRVGKRHAAGLARDLLSRVRAGESLSQALAARRDAVDGLYIAMVRAGEAAGDLAGALGRLAAYLERARAAADAVTSALIYPVILVLFAGLSLVYLMAFVVPQFEGLLRDAGHELPVATALLVAVSHALRDFGAVALLLLIAAAVGLRLAAHRPHMAEQLGAIALGLPVAGGLIARANTERFARALGALLAGGARLPEAVTLAAGTLSNAAMRRAALDTAAGLREGGTLGEPLAASGLFPALAVELVRVGEETGRLPEVLARAAEMQAAELETTVKRLIAVLVPAITVVMGVLVAGIILAVFAAIVSVNELVL